MNEDISIELKSQNEDEIKDTRLIDTDTLNLDITNEKPSEEIKTLEPEDLQIETNDDLEDKQINFMEETIEEENLGSYQENMQMFDTDIGSLKPISVNSNFKEYSVSQPMKNGTYITYLVSGFYDKQKTSEKFSAPKRYADFEQLREALVERWPGFLVPAIPPKQAIGNMDKDFILERKSMLNSFIRQLAKYKFFVESQEFAIFAINTSDRLQTVFKAYFKENVEGPGQKLKKYQEVCPIDLNSYKEDQFAKCKQTIDKFSNFIGACLISMKTRKSTHAELTQRRETQNKNYKLLLQKLYEYEKSGLDYYANVEPNTDHQEKRIIFKDSQAKIPESINTQDLGNPYRVMQQWIQSEIQDILAIMDCTRGLVKIQQKISELKQDLFDARGFLVAQQQKKTTIKGLWLKITGKELTEDEMMQQIQGIETEIEEWQQLYNYLLIYIPMVVIPRFKTDRGGQYFSFLVNFSQNQVKFCNNNIEYWNQVLESTKNLDDGSQLFEV